MKYIITAALIILAITACTNHNHHPVRTEKMEDNNTKMKIEDDGKTLSMMVKTRNTENPVDYDENFDIRDMNDKQKEKLKDHILDSLGVKKLNR